MKNQNNSINNQLRYDADGYLIDESLFNIQQQNNSQTFIATPNNNIEIQESNDNHESLDIDEIRNIKGVTPRVDVMTNPEIFSNFLPPVETYSQQYIDYNNMPLPTDYNTLVKNNYEQNENYNYNYYSAEIEEENPYMNEEEFNNKKRNLMIIISLILFYVFFLIVGAINTNFKDGYAQTINYQIKAERVVFNDVYDKIIKMSSDQQFAGAAEFDMLLQTGKYIEKKLEYNTLINKYISEQEKYQIKYEQEKNLINKEMYADYVTLLSLQEQLLTKVVAYYSYLNGDISTQTSTDLELLKKQILSEQASYAEKYNNVILNLEDIKKQLKL